jgi:Transposase domain (DUF772)
LPAASHPFYARPNQLLREQGLDDFAEAQCAPFYADTMGRPSLTPGIYFRLLLIGYFEGLDSEREIAWACGRFVCVARVSRRRTGEPSSWRRFSLAVKRTPTSLAPNVSGQATFQPGSVRKPIRSTPATLPKGLSECGRRPRESAIR